MPASLLIAIVDDDDSAREAIAALVRALGYLAAGFASAAEFLQSRELRTTACLIADLQMPEMSGLELHLCLVAAGSLIPTILVTAYPNETTRARALKAGVLCFLVKPFDPNELLDCLRAAVAEPDPHAQE